MRQLKIYRGIGPGDIIKINSDHYPNKKLAKVVEIYKKNDNVRFIVKIAGGIRLDIHVDKINFGKENFDCNCKLNTLMQEGCLCGGN